MIINDNLLLRHKCLDQSNFRLKNKPSATGPNATCLHMTTKQLQRTVLP